VRPSGPDLPKLLERCRLEDERAWEEFQVWARTTARWVLAKFGGLGRADREDIVATAVARLVPAIREGKIRGTTNLEIVAYVARTIKNSALNLVRSQRQYEDLEAHPGEVRAPQDEKAEGQAVLKIVAGWPPADRFVFVQKINGVSTGRIKAELEQPPYKLFIAVGTVDTRYHRLRERLREEFEGSAGKELRGGS
jgi:DNA-directed RNA polymerase specialized sigma24 family protein